MVKINDKLFFTANRTQYILYEKCTRTDPETGEEIEDKNTIGYYATIASLLRGAKSYILRKKIFECDIKTLDEVIAEIERLNSEEKKLLEGTDV